MRKSLSAVLALCLAASWPASSWAAAARLAPSPSFKNAPARMAGPAPLAFAVVKPIEAVQAGPRAAEIAASAQLQQAVSAQAPASAESSSPDSGQGRAAGAVFDIGRKVSHPSDAVDTSAPIGSFRQSLQRRAAVAGAAASVLVPAPAFASAAEPIIGETLKQLAPYGLAAAGLAATAAADRGVKWAINRYSTGRWDDNKTVVVRLVASVAVWTLGLTGSLYAAGVPTDALLASLGAGGLAVSLAAKELVNNLLEGVKVLLVRPFRMGDTIVIGSKSFKPRAMNLRYVEFGRYSNSTAHKTYSELSGKSITIQRPYEPDSTMSLPRRLPMSGALAVMTEHAKVSFFKASAWLAAGVGILFVLPYLTIWFPSSGWLAAALPWIQGLSMLFALRQAERWIVSVVDALSQRGSWDPTTAAFVRLAAQILTYAVGITVGLSVLGVTWDTLLKSMGVTSIIIAWTVSDVIGNLLQWFYIVYLRPFKVGDTLEVGAVIGKVVDMNFQYVVLSHKDGPHTLVPYSALKEFTVLDASDADTTAPKASADDDLPPSTRTKK